MEEEGKNQVYLIEEKDCCRVISMETNEIIQIVPKHVVSALKIGSFSSSALLLDATNGNDLVKLYETLSCLKKEMTLTNAVEELLQTSLFEFDLSKQERLLKSALKGKHFIIKQSDCKQITSLFALTLKHLRVLNIIREQKIGLPMTWKQYEGVINQNK